nr:hypothetical protein [Tanacetum cinerariifolium]
MSNTNNTMQTQTSITLHNAIMEAGGKDRPPMLAPGNYVQWKSIIKRYIDTKPYHERIHYCLKNPPYKYTWADKAVPVTKGSTETTTKMYMENYKNVSQDIRDQLNAEAEAIQIILTGIDNDIYSTVDACPNACEMWKAIERGTGYDNPRIGNVTGARETVGTTMVQRSGIQCYNCKEFRHVARECHKPKRAKDAAYHKEKMLLYQELEAHYMYMGKIQEVTPDAADNSVLIFDTEPVQKNDNDDLANARDLLASLIKKLKCEIDDSKNYLKKFQAELDRHNDVKYASKVEINCAKAKGDLMSYKMEFEKSSNRYTQKINDLNQTISKMKKELFAHQETISILSQQKEAHIKFHKTREDKELDKVIALENKVKVLDNIVYKTSQSVQKMNMLNCNCKMIFTKHEFLKKAQRENPRLYDICCYNDNLSLMLAPESDVVIRLEKESRSKLSDLIKPFDYEKLNNLYDLFIPQCEKSSALRYFSKRSKMSRTPINNENSKENFNKQTTFLEKQMDESIPYDQKCKSSKEHFKIKRSVATIFDGVERCKQTIAKRTYFSHIDPFIQNTIEGNFCLEIQRISADLEKFHLCLKEEMVADLIYFNSLELEVDSLKCQLETQKTQFLNEINQLSREYYYDDHMNAILGVYTKLDEVTNLQYSLERKDFSKSKSVTKNNVSNDFSKPVTTQILPPNKKSILKNTNVLAPGMYKLHTESIQTRTTQLPHDFRKTNKRVSFSIGVIPPTSVSRPQLKSNRMEDKVMLNNSQGKKQEVKEHRWNVTNVKFSKNKMSVTACNDSLKAKTLNVNSVCPTCGKYVLNVKHDMCVLQNLNSVNSRTKMPIIVPVGTREPKRTVNQSVAKPLRNTVASESTNRKPKHTTRKLYKHVSKACSWWYPKFTPPGYKWKPKSKIGNVNLNVIMPLEIILFIVDSGCSKHMTRNLKLLTNFVEKFLGSMKFGNDQIAPILDLEVAFRKSTCYICDLKGNDLLTGSCGTDLYSITLQDTSSPNPICLMAIATSSQAWVWHRRLSHLNFDTINLLSKNDIVIGLPKLKLVKDHLCCSCELGKAKRKSFQTKTTPSSKTNVVPCGLVQRGLHAKVRIVRTDKGTEFLNITLRAYFASKGINHQTSVARTPEQKGVVERRNRTLVEAARTMLSAAKVPLFFWAEAIATTCFTQNRSLVIPRHEKTPYHIINDRKPSVKFFQNFGSLCYIVRDGENLDKMKEKGDACIFVGYSTQSRAYSVFNKRTKVIVETVHVNFDKFPHMTSDHVSSDPVP